MLDRPAALQPAVNPRGSRHAAPAGCDPPSRAASGRAVPPPASPASSASPASPARCAAGGG
eukprot:6329536-Prymnesium_polylepis.1